MAETPRHSGIEVLESSGPTDSSAADADVNGMPRLRCRASSTGALVNNGAAVAVNCDSVAVTESPRCRV